MTSQNEFEKGFSQMASRLASAVSQVTGVSITPEASMDILSTVLFNQSEVGSNGSADGAMHQSSSRTTPSARLPYFIINYGAEMHLLHGSQLLKSNIPGCASWVSPGDFALDGHELAQSNNESELHFETLPQILGQNWSADDVIALAKTLGVLKTHFSVFVSVGAAILVRLNGRPSYTELNADYLQDIELAYEAGRDPFDVMAWEPETEDGDTYHFTLGDMAKAVLVNDGEVWRIPSKWGDVDVAILR